MAQIIKHRRGSLEALSAVTSSLQKGEIVIASGSSNLSVTNGASIVFAVPENGQVQAVNRFLVGANAPNTFSAGTYNGMLKGVPYYASGSSTLYLLGEGANEIPDLTGNISNFSSSVATSINALSSSIGGGSIGTSVSALNTFSGSTLGRLSNLETTSASVNTSIAALNSSSASQQISIDALNAYTSSNTSTTALNAFTASAEGRFTQIGVVSGSLFASASTAKSTNDTQDGRLSNLETTSASVNTSVAALNSFSSSQLTQNTALATITGSLISSASNANTRLTDIEAFSQSFDTAFNISGSNVEIAGNLVVKGTTTQVESTTIQLGDNIIELNGTGAANGGLLVKDPTAPNTVSGSLLWDSTNDYWKAGAAGAESKLLRADGDSVVSGSSQITLQSTTGFSSFDSALATITGSLISSASAASISNANQNTFSASALTRFTNLESTSASVNVSIAALNAYTSSNTSTTALNSFTASASGRLTSLESATASLQIETSNLETFSASVLTQLSTLGTYTASVDGRFTTIGTLTASYDGRFTTLGTYTGSVEDRFTTLATYTGSVNTSITNLNASSASQQVSIDNLNSFSSSVLTQLTEIGVVTASLFSSASAAKTKNDSQDVSITNLNTTSASVNVSISNINTFTSSFGTTFSSSVDSRLDTLEGTGTIQGVGTGNNVTFAKVTTTGDVVVGGDLVVQGNTVTLNTATLVVEDKLITLASGSTTSTTADGSGFEVAGANANFVYQHSTTAFTSSVALIAPAVTASINLGTTAGSSKRIAFRNTNGNLDLVPTASVAGDLLQWDGSDFVMSNVIDGGSF